MKPNADQPVAPESKPESKPNATDDLKSLAKELEAKLGSSPNGLNEAEARRRLAEYGYNEIAERSAEDPKVPDADEASWQDMKREAPQKLLDRQGHATLLVVVCGVAPPEGDLTVLERQQAVIGDGDSMRVAAEVAEDELGSADPKLKIETDRKLRA